MNSQKTAKIVVSAATLLALLACTQKAPQDSPSIAPPASSQSKTEASDSSPSKVSACELLSASEVAGFLKVPTVKKDDVESGYNEITHVDICNWYVMKGSNAGILIKIFRGEGTGEGAGLVAFSLAKGEAVEHDVKRDQNAESVSGVGKEAIYSPYPVGPGGNIAFRVDPRAVTITGSASKDVLVSMAKVAASRL